MIAPKPIETLAQAWARAGRHADANILQNGGTWRIAPRTEPVPLSPGGTEAMECVVAVYQYRYEAKPLRFGYFAWTMLGRLEADPPREWELVDGPAIGRSR